MSEKAEKYIDRQTARKLLSDTAKELRKQALFSEASGYAQDADNFSRLANQIESAIALTVGG